jgi:hypothetical protein
VTANGQGEMQGKIFRVAHLGFFDYLDTVALLGAMEHIAKDTLGCRWSMGRRWRRRRKCMRKSAEEAVVAARCGQLMWIPALASAKSRQN